MLFSFHIQLANITDPSVWRRIVVPSQFTFDRLHDVIQAAFGWTNSHLYKFSKTGSYSEESIGIPWEEDEYEVKNSETTQLSEIFKRKGQKYVYTYDYGDNWQHNMLLEEIHKLNASIARCIAGEGACPPEDCGAWMGYEDLKKIMVDPQHPEYKEMRTWIGLKRGATWDAASFDLDKADKKVRRV